MNFRINDRVISANNISLEGVDYATAVQVLRDSGQTVNLVVKRRVVLPVPVSAPSFQHNTEPQDIRVSLSRNRKKEDFGVVLGCKIYIKEIIRKSAADRDGKIKEGDHVRRINNTSLERLSLKEARKLVDASKDRLDLTVRRDPLSRPSKTSLSNLKDRLEQVNGDEPKGTSYSSPYGTRITEASTPPRPPPPEDGKIMQGLCYFSR